MESLIPIATTVCGAFTIILSIRFVLFLFPDSFRFTLQWLICSVINFISEMVGRFFFGEPIYVFSVHFVSDNEFQKMDKKDMLYIIANTTVSELTIRVETKEDVQAIVKQMDKIVSKMSNKAFQRKRAQMNMSIIKLDELIKEIEDAKKK